MMLELFGSCWPNTGRNSYSTFTYHFEIMIERLLEGYYHSDIEYALRTRQDVTIFCPICGTDKKK